MLFEVDDSEDVDSLLVEVLFLDWLLSVEAGFEVVTPGLADTDFDELLLLPFEY